MEIQYNRGGHKMKLKTLKDLNIDDYRVFCEEAVGKSELKAEAIKWVKDMEDYEIVNWEENFKDFFNIIEEDLK